MDHICKLEDSVKILRKHIKFFNPPFMSSKDRITVYINQQIYRSAKDISDEINVIESKLTNLKIEIDSRIITPLINTNIGIMLYNKEYNKYYNEYINSKIFLVANIETSIVSNLSNPFASPQSSDPFIITFYPHYDTSNSINKCRTVNINTYDIIVELSRSEYRRKLLNEKSLIDIYHLNNDSDKYRYNIISGNKAKKHLLSAICIIAISPDKIK